MLQLRPVTYVYKSGVDREFVGFVAQDPEQIMPSMVSQQRGLIDGEEVSDSGLSTRQNWFLCL